MLKYAPKYLRKEKESPFFLLIKFSFFFFIIFLGNFCEFAYMNWKIVCWVGFLFDEFVLDWKIGFVKNLDFGISVFVAFLFQLYVLQAMVAFSLLFFGFEFCVLLESMLRDFCVSFFRLFICIFS